MFKKSFLFLAVILAVLSFVGFGCKGLTAEQQQATAPVSLEYWTVYDDVDALQAAIDKYRASRPYLKVTVRQLRYDELYTRLVEALAEDKGPDIISVPAKNLRAFVTKLAPMPATARDTTVIQRKTMVNTVETVVNTAQIKLPDANTVDREFVQAVKKDAIVSGQIYGLPLSFDTMAIYYNKDLLDRSDVAETPDTWEKFQEAVKKISKTDKDTGRIVQSGAALGASRNVEGFDDLLYILFRQSNIDFVDASGRPAFNRSARTSGETASAGVMNFYTDFANPGRDTYSWNNDMGNSLDAFVQGRTAFFFGYSYDNATIQARAPQLNYGIMPMLQLNSEKPVNAANYWLQTVVGKSKKQNDAWALVNYLTRSQASDEYLTATKRPSARRALIAKQQGDPELAPFVSQILVADSWYRGKDYPTAQNALSAMVDEWLNQPPLEDLNRAASLRQDILNRAVSKINQTM